MPAAASSPAKSSAECFAVHWKASFCPMADLRKGGPDALAFSKRLVYEVPAMSQKDAFQWTAGLSGDLFKGEEAAEGMAAFLGKRPARWAGDPDD